MLEILLKVLFLQFVEVGRRLRPELVLPKEFYTSYVSSFRNIYDKKFRKYFFEKEAKYKI